MPLYFDCRKTRHYTAEDYTQTLSDGARLGSRRRWSLGGSWGGREQNVRRGGSTKGGGGGGGGGGGRRRRGKSSDHTTRQTKSKANPTDKARRGVGGEEGGGG